jgi:membrane associated rhomboid family serine protease
MFSFLNNIPPVTKNILILNILFFFLTLVLEGQGLELEKILGAFYVNSPLFQPFQMATHFFMHGGFMHIFMNMWLLLMMGSYLEKLWGPKKYFVFYLISALGAFALFNGIGVYKIYELKASLGGFIDTNAIDQIIKISGSVQEAFSRTNEYLNTLPAGSSVNTEHLATYIMKCNTTIVGASGAIFGIMAAFGILFPNTEFYVYGAIPVKAKFLIGGYFLLELYLSFKGSSGDGIAHLAHVGGAIAGAIMILYWRKTDKQNFW